MPDTSSLDALLDKIQSDTTLRLSDEPAPSAVPMSPEMQHLSAQISQHAARAEQPASTVAERNEMWESNLSPRQQSLPKLPAHMLGGIVAIMVLFVGVGAGTLLTQQNQDLRQQAFLGRDAETEVAGPSATMTEAEYQALMNQPESDRYPLTWQALSTRPWNTFEIVVVVAAGVAIVFLLGLLVWVFAL